MTQLENKIKQILSEIKEISNQKEIQRETIDLDKQRTQQYLKEFDFIYIHIESIEPTEKAFVEWANQHEIDDAENQIKDGAGFYQHLLNKARSAYCLYREKGFETKTAFDKSTSDLIFWIQKSNEPCLNKKLSNKESEKGVIYVNHSPEFLHRLRHMED